MGNTVESLSGIPEVLFFRNPAHAKRAEIVGAGEASKCLLPVTVEEVFVEV